MTFDTSLDLSESLEDYLEAILIMTRDKNSVRPKDIADMLKVTGPSVTVALKSLAQKKLINYAPYEFITFTTAGEQIAQEVYSRHIRLRSFLRDVLQVEPERANQVACRMEHAMPNDIIDKLVRFARFIEECPRGGKKWVSEFEYVCNFDNNCENCVRCLQEVQGRIERIQKELAERKAKCIPLSKLQPGQKGTIARINLSGDSLHRLLQTGATLGTPVEVDKAPVQGSSLYLRLKGAFLTMTVEDAEQILIDLIE